jgi:ribonuclease VapC
LIAVDTPALVAIVFDEAERDSIPAVLTQADTAGSSTVSALEARMVTCGRRGPPRAVVLPGDPLRLPPFLARSPDRNELDAAYGALLAFGIGSGHRAALNFGDVFSDAVAKVHDLPLLYKGSDFVHTDIRAAAG